MMPTYCCDCPCHNGENGRCNITGASVFDKRPFDCPLQEDKSITDVEEVKHGEWLPLKQKKHWADAEIASTNTVGFYCSVCGAEEKLKYRYCHYCGAKMEGKKVKNAEICTIPK